jgi:hypothetical protein
MRENNFSPKCMLSKEFLHERKVTEVDIESEAPSLRERQWFHLHNSAPAYSAMTVKCIQVNSSMVEISHPHYDPDPAPADFCQFHKVKTILKVEDFTM